MTILRRVSQLVKDLRELGVIKPSDAVSYVSYKDSSTLIIHFYRKDVVFMDETLQTNINTIFNCVKKDFSDEELSSIDKFNNSIIFTFNI